MDTMQLAKKIVQTKPGQVNEAALLEAKRSLLNFTGVAISASTHPMVDMVLSVAVDLGTVPQATLLGRSERVGMETAALINGISSHIQDYDDTILDTVLHPSAPVFPALLAYCERHHLSGERLLQAFVIGCEVEERVAQVVCPSHYDRGWHVTGSVGAFGAASAVGWLMGLDETRMAYALGLAATQPVGLREMFGTFTKPYHPGKAAANGLLAALLAEKGFTSSLKSIEALRGFAKVTSDAPDFARLTDGWGEPWLVTENSYKPFPCGIVTHPAIDAAMQLKEAGVKPEELSRLDIYVHPLAIELTGRKEPKDGLEAKFSVFHCAAAGLVDGWVGLAQFTDERVNSPAITGVRSLVNATVDPSIKEDQVRAVATLKNGQSHEVFVEHCIGSIAKPMTRAQLVKKFHDVTGEALDSGRQAAIVSAVDALHQATSLDGFLKLTVPSH